MKTSNVALFVVVVLTTIVHAAVPANFPQLMLTAVNGERAKFGLAPLCTNFKLQQSAQLHSDDQATNNFMSHTGSSGSTMTSRITAQQFNWNGLAENVAAGHDDVAAVMDAWMNSPGHRANILGNYKFFGTGYAFNGNADFQHYWTQDFGASSAESCDQSTTPTVVTPAPTASPVPLPPAPATPPSSPTSVTLQQRMLAAVNAERVKAGRAPLCTNTKLQAAAQRHSENQAANNFVGNVGMDGSTMVSRVEAQGFDWNSLGENVAAGQVDVAAVVAAWMNAPSQRDNILGDFTFFGMGYAFNANGLYKHHWTQTFGTSSSETCETTPQDSNVVNNPTTTPIVTPSPAAPTPAVPTTAVPTTAAPTPTVPTPPAPTPAPATTTPTAAPAPAPAPMPSLQQLMLTAVNVERAKFGLAPLCTNFKLQRAAQLHSEDQATNNFMDHVGSRGSTMQSRIEAQRFIWNSLGENVAAGQVDVAAVMAAWMNSPGHRANILGDFRFFGMGYAFNTNATFKHYWTQDFAKGSSEACDA